MKTAHRLAGPCPRLMGWAGIALLTVLINAAQAQPDTSKLASRDLSNLQTQAEQGDARAQVDLGLRYIEGNGVTKDLTKALALLKNAALQGDSTGQLELGVMYVNGEGVAEDLREGYAWYSLSSQQGNSQAKEYLKDLEGSLSPSDRAKAQARAAQLAKEIEGERAKKPKHGHRPQAPGKPEAAGKPVQASEPKVAAGSAKAQKGPAAAGAKKTFTEGVDYTIWQRARIKDENGFNGPVEAYSILLPKGWRTEGGVKWVVNVTCPAEAVQNRLTAVSPNGAYRLDVFPQRSWQWYDDPMLLQNAQRAAQFGNPGCQLARPYDAGQYLEQVFVPTELRGAQLMSHRPNEQLASVMRQQAQQNNSAYRAAGVNLESRPSAHIGRLRWADGRVGIVLCAVEQTVASMPNLLNGGTYASYQCRATVKTVMSAPAGQEEEAERILSTIVGSTRINPEWQAAVQRVYSNIAAVEQRETAKRAAIWRQTQNEISDIQRRTWEDSQASRDRIMDGWSQALRGVETWKEPGGGSIELSAGYNEAWSRADGTYILSNDPLFDPSVAFQEDWKRMEKGR